MIRNGGLARPLTRLSPELQPTRVATGGEYELARGVAREKGRRQKIDSASSGHVYLTLRPVIPAAADLLSRLDARALSFQKRCALQTCPIRSFGSLMMKVPIMIDRRAKSVVPINSRQFFSIDYRFYIISHESIKLYRSRHRWKLLSCYMRMCHFLQIRIRSSEYVIYFCKKILDTNTFFCHYTLLVISGRHIRLSRYTSDFKIVFQTSLIMMESAHLGPRFFIACRRAITLYVAWFFYNYGLFKYSWITLQYTYDSGEAECRF